jgi:hypothetical protein
MREKSGLSAKKDEQAMERSEHHFSQRNEINGLGG